MEHQNLQLAAVVKLSFRYFYFDSEISSSRFPCLFVDLVFSFLPRLPVSVNGVFCCEIFLARVTGEMLYCDFKAAANLNITNMQTLGFHWSFSCLECTCSGIGVL